MIKAKIIWNTFTVESTIGTKQKGKITRNPTSKQNSKQKLPYIFTKLKAETNGKQLSYF